MTNKEAIEILRLYKQRLEESCSNLLGNDKEAFDRAIKALDTLDKLGGTVYRDEYCPNRKSCYDYIGYHCANCIFSPRRRKKIEEN